MSYTEVFTDFICELLGDIALKFSAVYNVLCIHSHNTDYTNRNYELYRGFHWLYLWAIRESLLFR